MPWPSIANPDYPLTDEVNYPQIRTEFESGTVQSRPRWTRARRTFTLRWGAMTEAHYALLEAAFVADQGTTFSWTNPASSVTYTVRYKGDSLKGAVTMPGRRQVELILEEA
jgi:hypothetical protein